MEWSLRVGRLAGIDLKIHYLNLLLFAAFLAMDWQMGLMLLALFGFVLCHELGHGLVAASLGIRTRDIILFPLGGVARMEDLPRAPRIEFLVAIAGPAVNGAIFLFLLSPAVVAWTNDWEIGRGLMTLAAMNLFMALFNLIPIYPMDGSRVLRAGLGWYGLEFATATEIVAAIGKVLSAGMMAFGALTALLGLVQFGIMLLFMAAFCWFAGEQERQAIRRIDGRPSAAEQTAIETLRTRLQLHHQGIPTPDGWHVFPGDIRVRITPHSHRPKLAPEPPEDF